MLLQNLRSILEFFSWSEAELPPWDRRFEFIIIISEEDAMAVIEFTQPFDVMTTSSLFSEIIFLCENYVWRKGETVGKF